MIRPSALALLTLASTLLFTSNTSHAKSQLILCFENKETDKDINECLSNLNKDRDDARLKIEDDIIDMIEGNDFILPPEYIIKRTLTQKEKIFAQKVIDGDMNKLEKAEKSRSQQNYLVTLKAYQAKKKVVIKNLKQSKELFEEYRLIECQRHKYRFDSNQNNTYAALITEKACIYKMTNQRIKYLQDSVKE